MKRSHLFFCVLLLLLVAPPLQARSFHPAFSRIRVGVSGIQPVLSGSFSDHWSADPAFGGFLGMDVGLGWVQGEFSYGQYPAAKSSLPDHSVQFWSLAWDIPWLINPCVAIIPGVVAGSYKMDFEDPGASSTASNETEFAAGARLGMQICMVNPVFLTASAEYLRLFTNHPIDQVRYKVGLGATFRMPRKLREVLR